MAIISYARGDLRAAVGISAIVILSMGIAFVQEHQPGGRLFDEFPKSHDSAWLCGDIRTWRLLGVSGISGDIRVLLEDFRPAAKEALELFCFRIAGEIGRLAVSIGGVDAVVFTAGIGENKSEIRKGVERHLDWMGLSLREPANKANATVISMRNSDIAVFVIPTDEEQVISPSSAYIESEEYSACQ